MPAPWLVRAVVVVATEKKLRKVVVGVVLGILVLLLAPMAILLQLAERSAGVDWDSSEVQAQLYSALTEEEKAAWSHAEDEMMAIAEEFSSQGLADSVTKAQVLWFCALQGQEESESFYIDYAACFAEAVDDAAVFANVAAHFGVTFSAEEQAKIQALCNQSN